MDFYGFTSILAPLTPPSCEDDEEGGSRRQKRGVLPKQATAVMKAWLFQHIIVSYTFQVIEIKKSLSLT